MGRRRGKRSYDQTLINTCVGATLASLRASGAINIDSASPASAIATDNAEEWQVVESRASKRRKKQQDDYPSISYSTHARLQSFVKLGDLQHLVTYVLADGVAPQWCSISHRSNVRKVVVLMVPGLESGMFDGKISLSPSKGNQTDATDEPFPADSHQNASKATAANDDDADDDGGGEDARSKPTSKKIHISPDDYYPVIMERDRLPLPLQPLSDLFSHMWPIKTPGDDKYSKMYSPVAALLAAPVPKTKEEKKAKGPQSPVEGKNWKNHRTPITKFLASTAELIEEGYVLHPAHYDSATSREAEINRRIEGNTTAADGWVDTDNIPTLASGKVPNEDFESGSITRGRKVLAIDCEMCLTSPSEQPKVFSLTRVSVVDWNGEVVLDELVKPADPITDYLTNYSGITADLLKDVTTSLADIQQRLQDILTPNSILIGHSLNSDLNALKLTHPFIIDTALIFPHPRGPPLKSSLKWLAQRYLSREIQKGHGSSGHDSIEDARACLDLVKQKCEKGKAWGMSGANNESIFVRLSRAQRPKRDKTHPDGAAEPRIGAMIDWNDPVRGGYGAHAHLAISCKNDDDVVLGVKRALGEYVANFDSVASYADHFLSHRSHDFTWARMRELETFRGWCDPSETANSDGRGGGGGGGGEGAERKAATTLADVVTATVGRIVAVHTALPPCSALIVYSGSGDPHELREMQALQKKFKDEYREKKWDDLSVRWTDVEEQKLREACRAARKGIGFVVVK